MGLFVNIEIKNQQKKYSVNQRFIKTNAETILSLCRLKNVELSILIVNNRRMRAINRQYRGKNSSTDVLSFPMNEVPPPLNPIHPVLLGDIVISMEKTHKQAKEQGHSPSKELLLLLTHGILHLTGYDHELSPAEERRMRKKENMILAKLTEEKISKGKLQMAEG
ncbi:MAG: rRNA maturation RNase YbeY [Nitrospirae bacterium]|nr:rRNA maturation RNase YbeY [Nitrospirota bacterium]